MQADAHPALAGLDPLVAAVRDHGLSAGTVAALLAIAERKSLPHHHQLLSDREPSDAVYMVVEGRLIATWRDEDRRAPLRAVLGPGELVGEDALVRRGAVGAWTLGATTVLRVEARALQALAARTPELSALLDRITAIQGRRGWVLRQLRRSSLLRHAAPADLAPLLRGATLQRGAPGERLHDGTAPLPGLLVVLDGDVLLRSSGKVRVGNRSVQPPELAMGAGAVIGDVALAQGAPLLHDVVAGADGCRLLVLPRVAFDQTFATSLSFRRAVLSSPALDGGERTRLLLHQARVTGRDLRVFQTVVSDDHTVDLGLLTRWLAEAAAEEWGDRVAIVRPEPGLAAAPPAAVEALGEGELHTCRIPINGHGPTPALVATLLRCDMAFLDLGALSPAERQGPWLDRAERFVVVGTRAYDQAGADPLLARGGDLPLYTAVVPSEAPPPGAPRAVPYGSPRLHRTLIEASRRGTARRALSAEHREQVHRWMRAVTGRRLGVALGGGGALSFAEVAVLQRLHEAGIPVDMVAGVSGGAIVGAFYTAGGDRPLPPGAACPPGLEDLPGLARLAQAGGEMERTSMVALVTGWAVASFLERHLGHRRLEDLLVPFFPVCVDGDHAVQTHLHAGPVAYGARASGSFPGTFTPTTMDLAELRHRVPLPGRDRRDLPSPEDEEHAYEHHLDGGLLNNIPDDTLFLEGAQLVLACNVVPAPGPRKETGSRLALRVQAAQRRRHGRVARFLAELSPVVRFDDLSRAIYMLMFQPADWAARTADVKYQATTRGYSFAAWSDGDAIRRQALEEGGEAIDQAIAEVRRARDSLRWRRDDQVDHGALAEAVLAAVTEA